MSEYLDDAEYHETEKHITVTWRMNEIQYALRMGHEFFDALDVTDGQEPPVLMKLMVHDEPE